MTTATDAILQKQGAREIYEAYLRQFNAGKSPATIVRQLKRDHLDLEDDKDLATFWPAIALAQWECDELAPETFRAVQQVQARTAADDPAIADLLTQIQSPHPTPKPKHPADRSRAPFSPGDCVAFKLPDDRWGAALVVSSRPGSPRSSFLKLLRYREQCLPEIEIFQSRQWLRDRRPDGTRSDDPFVLPLPGSVVTAATENYHLVGKLPLAAADDFKHYTLRTGDIGKIAAGLY